MLASPLWSTHLFWPKAIKLVIKASIRAKDPNSLVSYHGSLRQIIHCIVRRIIGKKTICSKSWEQGPKDYHIWQIYDTGWKDWWTSKQISYSSHLGYFMQTNWKTILQQIILYKIDLIQDDGKQFFLALSFHGNWEKIFNPKVFL